MNWFDWCVFLFLTAVLAMYFGLPAQLGRVACAIIWTLMLVFCVLRLARFA